MANPEEELLGYLLGALEDAERIDFEQRLRADYTLRERLADARCSLMPLCYADDEIEPPAGLAARTCRLVARQPRKALPSPACAACAQPSRSPSRLRSWSSLVIAAGLLAAAGIVIAPAGRNSSSPSGRPSQIVAPVNLGSATALAVSCPSGSGTPVALVNDVSVADRLHQPVASHKERSGSRVVLVSTARGRSQGEAIIFAREVNRVSDDGAK